MRNNFLVVVLSGCSMLHGCSPTLNWRDVQVDHTPLTALFPCKPESTTRRVSLGAQSATLTMRVCDAGNATFALTFADAEDTANMALLVDHWKAATLANIGARTPQESAFEITGASLVLKPVAVRASGFRVDGRAVNLHAVWFAVGSQVFQAVVYADPAERSVAETYFYGLRLR